ncbi:membrane protein insertase YidC [Rhodobacteraceae bacterium NNCM2]|nr:membrane protein insertase YidC [Coraliihabitans acroporae]
MKSEDTKNMILAIVLSLAVLLGWQFYFAPPPPDPSTVGQTAQGDGSVDGVVAGSSGGVVQGTTATDQPQLPVTRAEALDKTKRIGIENAAVNGSISLKGGRLDDLHLSDYKKTLAKDSGTVTLLNPTGGPHPYYATYGWLRTAEGDTGNLPDPNTEWTVESGDKLTPGNPVTLVFENEAGLTFRRTYELDDRYMFTVTQSVENKGENAVNIAPYGYVARRDLPDHPQLWILHEGGVANVDDELVLNTFSDLRELPNNALERANVEAHAVSENGWVALTDKYWLTALIPMPGQAFDAVYKSLNPETHPEYRAEMRMPLMNVAPGETASIKTRYFAGAKEYDTLWDYEDKLGIKDLHNAIDWGWFYFLTQPLFWLLLQIYHLIGNMGYAILVLTLLVKAVLFPLAYKSYVSMGKMKKLQPEMEKLKERCGDDKQKMQKEMMELYKKEKVNPAAGCLPILLQIPIFFSLYKVLNVAIEMRHAPFILWIHDLSAPDPTSFINLFGALPFEVPSYLAIISIGVFPILMGITMWMQQKLNPAPTDPTQAMIFAWMPWVFMFMLGTFASGLVIYWCANNILTFIQQYSIMRSQGVEVDFFGNVKATFKRKKKVPATDTKK